MRKIILLLAILFVTLSVKEFEIVDYKEFRINQIKTSEFSYDLLVEYIELTSHVSNDIPLRQFILETNWFKSKLFTDYNNIAGMKYPRKRITTAVSEKSKYAVYNHWTDSVDDYMLLISFYKNKGYNVFDYYHFLIRIGYASDNNYVMKLKQINI